MGMYIHYRSDDQAYRSDRCSGPWRINLIFKNSSGHNFSPFLFCYKYGTKKVNAGGCGPCIHVLHTIHHGMYVNQFGSLKSLNLKMSLKPIGLYLLGSTHVPSADNMSINFVSPSVVLFGVLLELQLRRRLKSLL